MEAIRRFSSGTTTSEPVVEDARAERAGKARSRLSTAFRRSADLLMQIAQHDRGVDRLFDEMKKIPSQRAREAAFEALGFEEQVARGLAWRAGQGMPDFDSHGVANVLVKTGEGKFGPDRADCRKVLVGRAAELETWSLAIGSLGSLADKTSRVADRALDAVGWAADVGGVVKSGAAKLAAPIGVAVSGIKLLKNGQDWEMAKLMAMTPGMKLGDLARARTGYLRGFGNGLVGLVTLGIPLGGILTDVVDNAVGVRKTPALPDRSLCDILQEVAGNDH